ncbi:MAG TPA: VOC family protein [Atopostipes sp.]|nr:VOC family protein [Atopostipes sp.]
MERIVPHLWFNDNAKEAVNFYRTLFDDSKMMLEQKLDGTPSGENAAYYEFTLAGNYLVPLMEALISHLILQYRSRLIVRR